MVVSDKGLEERIEEIGACVDGAMHTDLVDGHRSQILVSDLDRVSKRVAAYSLRSIPAGPCVAAWLPPVPVETQASTRLREAMS